MSAVEPSQRARPVELSHEIRDRLVTYPGLPPVRIGAHLSHEASKVQYAPGTTFHIARIDLVANTGTYLDVPFHRDEDAQDLAEFGLAGLVDLPGRLVRAPEGQRALGPELFEGLELAGRAVLVRTDWSRRWGRNAYFVGHPYLCAAAAELLVAAAPLLVGIDSLNLDDTRDPARPAHTALLRAGIPIVEHLCNLEALPESGFRFFAAPPRLVDVGSFPVRAFALVP